jgi:hypothetical protein
VVFPRLLLGSKVTRTSGSTFVLPYETTNVRKYCKSTVVRKYFSTQYTATHVHVRDHKRCTFVLSYFRTFVLSYILDINVVLYTYSTRVRVLYSCTVVLSYEGTEGTAVRVHVRVHVNPHVERPLESFYC